MRVGSARLSLEAISSLNLRRTALAFRPRWSVANTSDRINSICTGGALPANATITFTPTDIAESTVQSGPSSVPNIARVPGVVDWQSNDDVQRLMRRDIKRELRPTGDYTEERLDELANQTVELARRRIGQ